MTHKVPARVFTGLLAASLAGVLLVASCTQPLEPILVEPTTIAAVASTITTKAGRSVSGVAFTVADQLSAAMQGETVNFTVDGGTVSPATVQTDESGKAVVGGWVVPNTPGTYHLTAKVAGTSLQAQVAATVDADDPAIVAAAANSNDQSAAVGTAVSTPPALEVKDKFGNPVRNVQVTFAVASGGGSITGANATTDASGIAKVGSWVLGTTIGANTLTATVPGSNINGNPFTFNATGTAGPPASIVIAPGSPSSQGQTAIAGTAVSVAPAVLVRDANNNPVAGVVVIMKVASGGGKVLASATASGDSVEFTTNTSGIAKAFGWNLGALGGNSLAVNVKGSSVAGFTITATGVAGAAASVTVVAETPSSNNQTAIAQQTTAVAPAVVVKDAGGNVVSGESVTFTITGGNGTVLTSSTDLTGAATTAVTTNSSGVARVSGWKLGDPGAQSLDASLTSNSSIKASFSATSTSGPAASITIVSETPSSNNQSAIGNTTLPVSPAVVVKDANGYAVSGSSIEFKVTAGGGSLTAGTTTASTVTVATSSSGVARVTGWKIKAIGTNANTVVATVLSATSLTATFTATGVIGPPVALNKSNLPYGFVRQSTTVLGTPRVFVADAGDNGVPNITVTWAVSGTNSTATGTLTSTSSSGGIATFPGTWTAGATLGTATLVATISSPALTASFTTKIVGAPTQMAVSAGNNQSVTVGTAASVKPAVILKDAAGDPVPGNSVTFAITGGSGTLLSPTTVSTDSVGVATVGGWQMPNVPATQTMSATATGSGISGNPLSFTATAVAGPPSTITITAGNNQTAAVNSQLSLSVLVKDALSNPIPSTTVTFTPQGTNNAVASPSSTTTNASGVATTTWRIDTIAGTNTLIAAAGSSVTATFTATGTALGASKLLINGGNNQTGVISSALATAPSVKVTDPYNNPISGQSVTFTPGSGSGTVIGSPATSNGSGIASLTSWTLGSTVGTQTLTAALTANSAVNVAFTATGTSATTCNDRTIALGTTQSGTFGSSECTTTISSTLVRYQGFLMTVPSSTTTQFSATMSSSAFAPRLQSLVYSPTTAYWYSDGSIGSPVTNYYILGAGSHRINATTTTSGSTGAYDFSTVSNPSLAGVCYMIATKGISVSHSLDSSCSYTSGGASDAGGTTASRYFKAYQVFVPSGTTITARMSSSSSCTGATSPPCRLLEIYNASSNAFISTDNGSGTLVYTASSDTFIRIIATHRLQSGWSPQTGAYTFSIDP